MAIPREITDKKEAPQELLQGILDHCRGCGVEIIRKARTRPKICKECEKKKSKSIEDKCMDCHRQISGENVRKARRCGECKEKVRMLKKEVKKRQKTDEESIEKSKFQPPHVNDVIGQRIYATNNRIRFLQETQQAALTFCQLGYSLPACFREDGLYCEWSEILLPPSSHAPKINTECFASPEEIVEHILFMRSHGNQEGTGKKVIENDDDDDDDDEEEGQHESILVPLQIELKIDPNVPITTSRIEVEIVDDEMESNDSVVGFKE